MAPTQPHITLPPLSEYRLRKHRDTLANLSTATRKARRNKLLEQGKRGLVRCICECADNYIKDVVPLTKDQLTKLRQNKQGVRYLAKRYTPIREKEAFLNQEGGGIIPLILGPVIKALSGLIF